MTRLLPLLLLACSLSANAVVIRHDVDDADYRIPDAELAALAVRLSKHAAWLDGIIAADAGDPSDAASP